MRLALGKTELSARAVRIVDDGLARLQAGENESLQSVIIAAHATKGFSLKHLNRLDDALAAWDVAVEPFLSIHSCGSLVEC